MTDERRLLRMMAAHGIAEFYHSDETGETSLSLDGLTPLHPEICAQQAGRFHASHPAEAKNPTFPRSVTKGEIIAFLKIGALLFPVTASADAVLPPPVVTDGAIVGYGDPLF
jgi:hypothetical protein